MIVKVQQSLASSHNGQQALIYDEKKTIFVQCALTLDLFRILRERPKAYFNATVDAQGTLQIGDEVPEQNW